MSRSNCLVFALAMYWWRLRRWRADDLLPEPYLVVRPSRAGGPFHMLVGTMSRCGLLRLVSYKPIQYHKSDVKEPIRFVGHVVRGDA